MPRVMMMCGRLCSGKTTYAARLRERYGAVVLSVDELMLSFIGPEAGDMHDEYVARAMAYLYQKSLDIVAAGANVVLDWGFWSRKERQYAREFYGSRGIDCELHYLHISDEEWRRRVERRNADVCAGFSDAYFVDEGLMAKFEGLFEAPEAGEVDAWVEG